MRYVEVTSSIRAGTRWAIVRLPGTQLEPDLLVYPSRFGAKHTWVDIEDRSVDVWRSRTEHEVVRDVIRWQVPTTGIEATIDLTEVFAGFE